MTKKSFVGDARVRALRVRPLRSADLCFNSSGILDERNLHSARLGARIHAFNFATEIQSHIDAKEVDQTGRFTLDAKGLETAFAGRHLYALRNDGLGATLGQIIAQRQIAYLQKYAHVAEIVKMLEAMYPGQAAGALGKIDNLEALLQLSTTRKEALDQAYKAETEYDWSGVVREAISTGKSVGTTISQTETTPVGVSNSGGKTEVRAVTALGGNAGGNADHTVTVPNVIRPEIWDGGIWAAPQNGKPMYPSQKTTIDSTGVQQRSVSRGFEFRHPVIENQMRDARAQADLQDELLANRTFALRIPDMKAILAAELQAIDLEIVKTQLRYSQTFLVSPITGRVTAVYKDVGEAVQAGEPVLRVENDEELLLVGQIQYRAALHLDSTVVVRARGVFESGADLEMNGRIVSLRGHDAGDDVWDVVIETKNRSDGQRLPLNYCFDKADTDIEIKIGPLP